ncbi:MAG: glycosyltransferase family 2 protein [Candidatus Rokuibacteriota bacterium]|nr:MAG: glycosyltransferase family 2 protein [Candidatus Rokubacteria bacterium]
MRVLVLPADHRAGVAGRGHPGLGEPASAAGRRPGGASALLVTDVSAIVVAYDGLPWIERCLESVRGHETVVVDHGSGDGTVELVRERFPEARLVEQPNLGMGAGSNAGMRIASGDYFLLLNSDAWVLGDGIAHLAAFADEHPDAAIVGPRLLNQDGSLQRSVRGFPTLWRLATEYFFLRKLGPRTRLLNAFYGAGFAHDEPGEVEWLFGPCLLVRREATDVVGLFDENFFMFSEETDWCYRFRQAGWTVRFYPGAEVVHVGGASHGGRLYIENLRGHLRFFAKHRGQREAERVRRLLLWGVRLRTVFFRGERRRTYEEAARWLASDSAAGLLDRTR